MHAARVQGTDDPSYQAACETQDSINEYGVRLSKEIVKVSGKYIKKLTTLRPFVFPLSD